ncbi:hypothetical protein ACHAWO_012422 [Cyclotella atomus]|uniref:Cyclin N-terminal domain-containing protein n=1 Tax=Cyclotella atomus TaxID=382360 RepID=A0ABD3NER0_9STRA
MLSRQGMQNNSLLIDQLSSMFYQESTTKYKSIDYMNSEEVEVYPSDRESLCVWGYSVVAACRVVDRSVVAAAISYFDRYLSSSDPSAKQALTRIFQFQLAFVGCLVIALKDIIDTEGKILKALNWYLNGPTPNDFIEGFLGVVPPFSPHHIDSISRYSKHIVDLGMTNYFVAMHCPSKIAFTSICCALRHVNSLPAIDGLAIRKYLEVMTGLDLNCDDQELQLLLQTMLLGGSGVSLTKDISACLRNRKILIERKASVLNCDLE